MKKTFSVLLSATIYCLALINTSKAQQSLAVASISGKTSFAHTPFNEDETASYKKTIDFDKVNMKSSKAALKAMKANFKALKNFQKQFRDSSDVKWINYNEVIMARFTRQEMQTSVAYNKNGQWLHTITYMEADKMPEKIKSEVENSFPEYIVSGASEIKEDNITFYLVYIENCTSLKQISVVNDEVSVYKEFRKNN